MYMTEYSNLYGIVHTQTESKITYIAITDYGYNKSYYYFKHKANKTQTIYNSTHFT